MYRVVSKWCHFYCNIKNTLNITLYVIELLTANVVEITAVAAYSPVHGNLGNNSVFEALTQNLRYILCPTFSTSLGTQFR